MVKIKLGKTQESYSGHAFRDTIDADLIFHAVEQVIRYLVYTAVGDHRDLCTTVTA